MESVPWSARDAKAGASTGIMDELKSSCGDQQVFDSPHCPLHFPYLQLPLGEKLIFWAFPEHPAASPRTCCCARDAAHPRQFQLVKVRQARLLPGYLGLVFFSFSFTLGLSTSSADGIFIMFFCEVHMAYKREYLFNCKTWPPVQILMNALSICLHTST